MSDVFSDLQVAARATKSVALLVDGENISACYANLFLEYALRHGALTFRRVYGNATQTESWEGAPGFRHIHSGSGKNAADMLLAIDAVDLAHTGKIGTFVIASSDRDFTHLAHYLRERHFRVIGIGEAKTADAYRSACSEFIEVEASAPASRSSNATASDSGKIDDLSRLVHEIISSEPGKIGIPITTLNERLYKSFRIRISDTRKRTGGPILPIDRKSTSATLAARTPESG